MTNEMTNEDAIAWLEHHFDPLPDGTKQSEAVSLAIKALETITKYKDAYNKGWDDGAKATYEHLKMCEEEQGGDLISRDAVNMLVDELARAISDERCCMSRGRSTATIMQDILDLSSVNPQEPKTGYCKDCKWWKDSDGVFRRGIGAESQCPMNRIEVLEGNGYCYMFEPRESEDKNNG